jgi:hypothetical protein
VGVAAAGHRSGGDAPAGLAALRGGRAGAFGAFTGLMAGPAQQAARTGPAIPALCCDPLPPPPPVADKPALIWGFALTDEVPSRLGNRLATPDEFATWVTDFTN